MARRKSKPAKETDPLMSKAEAAEFLGISIKKLESLYLREDEIKVTRIGRRVLIRKSELDAYLDRHTE